MSDFKDESETTATEPDSFEAPAEETTDEATAPRPTVLETRAQESAPPDQTVMYTESAGAGGESDDAFGSRSSGSIDRTEAVEATRPFEAAAQSEADRYRQRPPLDPYRMESPYAEKSGQSIVEQYRASRESDRTVRPLDPLPPGLADEPMRRVTPVAPPPRTHYYPAPSTQPDPPSPSRWPVALLAFASGLLGALLVLGGLFAGGVFDEAEPPPTTAPAQAAAPAETVVIREVIAPEDASGVATAVGLKVVPSIVTVEVGSGDALSTFQAFGSGSGVVFSEDGLILTNHHVIEGAATSRVIFQDGRIYEATIMGSDELTDIAVLKIEATGLTPIDLGSTAGLRIGDRAIAVGNPLGLEGGASLTVGVVSAFDREVDTGDATPLFGMLQTDAPITNGSSGGALVNAEGQLIGITTAIGVSQSGAEGIGFATPVELVERIADQIIEKGDVAHAFLGVQLRPNFAIQEDGAAVPTGAIVADFGQGASAARDAGLEVNDVILSWDGHDVRTMNDLITGIRAATVGETVTLIVDRDGEELSFDVVLGERPEGT